MVSAEKIRVHVPGGLGGGRVQSPECHPDRDGRVRACRDDNDYCQRDLNDFSVYGRGEGEGMRKKSIFRGAYKLLRSVA